MAGDERLTHKIFDKVTPLVPPSYEKSSCDTKKRYQMSMVQKLYKGHEKSKVQKVWHLTHPQEGAFRW